MNLLMIDDDALRKIVDTCHPLELAHLFTTCKRMRHIIISSGRVAYFTATTVVCLRTFQAKNNFFHVQTYKHEDATDMSGIDRAITAVISAMPNWREQKGGFNPQLRSRALSIVRQLATGQYDRIKEEIMILGVKLSRNLVHRIRTKYLVHKEKCTPQSQKVMSKKAIRTRFKKWMPKKAPFPL